MSTYSVNRFSKLAAASLALLLFATPLTALANCSAKAAMAGHCGGEHCPMMHAQQSNTQISEAPSGDGSCCQMSSLPPGMAKPAVTNEIRISLQPATAQTPAMATAPVVAQAPGPPAVVLAVGRPQALLCTFLI